MSDFKPGDIVRLKSHPQEMVIENIGQNQPVGAKIVCVWISDFGDPHRETYGVTVLEMVEGEDPRKADVLAAARGKGGGE